MEKIFSVIVLLYNNSEYLEECLCSILEQDYPCVEIVVVDDGSRKIDLVGIENYIRTNKKKNIYKYIVYQNDNNLGTVKSANGAIRKSSGEYIKLLAADDALYDSKTLSKAADALVKSPCGIITGDVIKCDENLKPISKYRNSLPEKINELEPVDVFRRLCVHNDIVAGGVFFSKLFIDQYGLFDESYRLMEDWPTWLIATRNGCRIVYFPFNSIRYRSNGGIGTSTNPIYMSDKKRTLKEIIIPSKKILGLKWYLLARISFGAINSPAIRKLYGMIFRKGK